MTLRLLCLLPLGLALGACATTDAQVATTSNMVTGNAAASASGTRAIGAYGALGTSDDVRGRGGSAGDSPLTGRANMAGSDSGTPIEPTSEADEDAKPPRR